MVPRVGWCCPRVLPWQSPRNLCPVDQAPGGRHAGSWQLAAACADGGRTPPRQQARFRQPRRRRRPRSVPGCGHVSDGGGERGGNEAGTPSQPVGTPDPPPYLDSSVAHSFVRSLIPGSTALLRAKYSGGRLHCCGYRAAACGRATLRLSLGTPAAPQVVHTAVCEVDSGRLQVVRTERRPRAAVPGQGVAGDGGGGLVRQELRVEPIGWRPTIAPERRQVCRDVGWAVRVAGLTVGDTPPPHPRSSRR